jgi:pimeloyl-ACP methyl ester carboxylesterase
MPGRLHIHWSGRPEDDAPTLVLLHGITNSGAGWPDAVSRWAGTYRIAAIDALGHGSSDRFRDDELSGEGLDAASGAVDALVTTTTEALEAIEATSGAVVLHGHSMGGATAAVVAATRPDLLRGVLLEDPAWQEPSAERWARRGAAWVAGAHADREDPAAAIAHELADPANLWSRAEIEPWVLAHTQIDDRFVGIGRTEMTRPWPEVVAALDVPTLIVTGSDDGIVDAAMRQQLAAIANPHVEVEVVEGAGHSVRRDRTDAFHAVADPWIAARFA